MLTRFLSISLFAFSSSLWGVACNRSSGEESQPSASCERPAEIPDPTRQWELLIGGNPNLPAAVTEALRRGAREEESASNPCVAVREGRVSTVSMENHYREAVRHYQDALGLLEACSGSCGDRVEVRRRVNDKIVLLSISVESLSDMNRRFLPVPGRP